MMKYPQRQRMGLIQRRRMRTVEIVRQQKLSVLDYRASDVQLWQQLSAKWFKDGACSRWFPDPSRASAAIEASVSGAEARPDVRAVWSSNDEEWGCLCYEWDSVRAASPDTMVWCVLVGLRENRDPCLLAEFSRSQYEYQRATAWRWLV